MNNFNTLLIEIARKDTALNSIADILYGGNHESDSEIILDSIIKHEVFGLTIDASYRIKSGEDKSNFYQLSSIDNDGHIICQTEWRLIPLNSMLTNSLNSMIEELITETAKEMDESKIDVRMKENQQSYYGYNIQEAYQTISKDDEEHRKECEKQFLKEATLLGDYGCKLWLEREFGPMD